ncbi:hypothetical protein MP228_007790 [Amoeboaphelidium protococcarum]|nr:hypothetical protein MP228_007790 [Amoeboaphelidium protococcarum]
MTQTQYQDLIQDCLAKNGIVTAKYLEQKASLNNQQGGQFLADFAQCQSAYPSLGTLVLRKEQTLDADGVSHCKFSLSLLNSLENSAGFDSQSSVYALVNDLAQDYKVLLSNLNSLAHQEVRAVEASNNTPKVHHSASFAQKNNQVKQVGDNSSTKKANNRDAAPVKKSPTEKKSVPDAILKKKKPKMVLSDDDNDEADAKQQNDALMQSAASFSQEELDNIFDFDAKSSANSQQSVQSVSRKNEGKDGELNVSNLELDDSAEEHQDRKPSAVQSNLDTVVVTNAKRKKAITKKNTFVNDQGKIVTETTTEYITDDDNNDNDGDDERRDGNSGASNRVTKKAKTESAATEKNSGMKRSGAASKQAPKSSGAKQSKLSFFAAKPPKNKS